MALAEADHRLISQIDTPCYSKNSHDERHGRHSFRRRYRWRFVILASFSSVRTSTCFICRKKAQNRTK